VIVVDAILLLDSYDRFDPRHTAAASRLESTIGVMRRLAWP